MWKEGVKRADIFKRLKAVCGEGAPCEKTVYNWVESFAGGRQSTEDAERGRPSETATGQENVERVETLIADNPRVTITDLSEELGISRGSVHEILRDHLNVRKVTARWVPKFLTPDMKRTRVEMSTQLLGMVADRDLRFYDRIITGDESWFYLYEPQSKSATKEWRHPGEAPPIKVRAARSVVKRMALIFWDCEGVILLKWVPEGTTANTHFYCEALRAMREATKRGRRGKLTRGILLQQDNAPPHTSATTMEVIRDLGFQLVPHPPYSPDLAPSDYWLFGPLKQHLRGNRYGTIQEIGQVVNRWLRERPDGWFAAGIQKLTERWQRCVQKRGDYVEVEGEYDD